MMNLKTGNQMQNGFIPQNQQPSPQHRSSLSRQFDPSSIQGASPDGVAAVKQEIEPERTTPVKKPMEDPFTPDVLPPSRHHGPVNVSEILDLGQSINELKPTIPTVRELGVIDIHALTQAIKSGMHAETRVALDTLVTLSTEPQFQLSLVDCDDLTETLIDCAQEQIDYLAEHSAEVSDEMSLTPYEDLVRACKLEAESLQDIPEFGTVDYDLDRASERLICITTLIRNFSFYEANFVVLGQTEVLRLLSTIIRYLGTKEMILRKNRNTLDFMKDVIIYLSNLGTSLNLPSKQEALCLLHFLLAFAPTPSPTSSTSDKVSFTPYTPSLHRYMPSAVDSLAKLLARDEPNRTFYKSVFAADALSSPAFELLTRTFGLAIAPVPQSNIQSQVKALIEARKPFLLQGMLAAEILATMVPSSDHPLARSWLESEDGFAVALFRLVSMLSADKSTSTQPPPPRHPNQHPQSRHGPETDANAYGAITTRSLAVLKTLVRKSRVVDEDGRVVLPAGIMPKKENLLGALMHKDIDPAILRSMCVYKELED
jgi:SWI/SNF chromatin-remodeling complex subunit SWI1